METKRLVLRELAPSDADALELVLSDPETMKYYPAPIDQNGIQQWIEHNLRRYAEDGVGLWAMVLKATGEMIGDCGITRQHVEGEHLMRSDITSAAINGDGASSPKRP